MVRDVHAASCGEIERRFKRMITLVQLAEIFENGLNGILNDPEIQFKIWATVGKKAKSVRNGNTVISYITGILQTNSSANEANLLVMGVNGLSLEFSVPTKTPRTNAEQKAAELQEIENGQYKFVDRIVSAINKYFENAQTFTFIDGEIEYGISFRAGTCLTGDVGMASQLGKNVTVSVYIECYFLQGGVNSKDVIVSVDGVTIPYQNIKIGRSNRLSNDVYSGDLIVKNISTASALSIDFAMPANSDNTTQQAKEFLLHGDPNVSHFVRLQYGDGNVAQYLMMFDSLITDAQGITFAGITGSLVEMVDNPLFVGVPDYFQVGRFAFSTSDYKNMTFNITECTGYICGQVRDMNDAQAVSLSEQDFVYDEESDQYYIYLITSTAATITNSTATFEVIKAAKNG